MSVDVVCLSLSLSVLCCPLAPVVFSSQVAVGCEGQQLCSRSTVINPLPLLWQHQHIKDFFCKHLKTGFMFLEFSFCLLLLDTTQCLCSTVLPPAPSLSRCVLLIKPSERCQLVLKLIKTCSSQTSVYQTTSSTFCLQRKLKQSFTHESGKLGFHSTWTQAGVIVPLTCYLSVTCTHSTFLIFSTSMFTGGHVWFHNDDGWYSL